ncbi:MAG: hypothetical protein WBP47_24050 [Candidatus Promineifilaceae bacterium]
MKRFFLLALSLVGLLFTLSHNIAMQAQTTPRLVVFEAFMRPA